MKKKISIFVHCYPPAKGGAEYLTEKLTEVLNKKYEVHIFTGRGENLDSYKNFSNYIYDNIPNIHRLEQNIILQKIANRFLNKIIFKAGFFSPFYFGPNLKYTKKNIEIIYNSDIIIGVAMPTKSFTDAYSFAKKFHKKLILVPAYHNVNYYNGCYFFQRAFDYSDKIFYLTPFEKIDLSNNYKINPNKMHQTTFCPFSLTDIEKQEERNIKKINEKLNNLKSKTITLGFVGQITLRKNLGIIKDYLNKYTPYWESNGFTITLLLAGARTNSSQRIESLFKDFLKNHAVKIIYDFKEIKHVFRKIDILINPSTEESLGIVNFEAIYFGLPIFIHSSSAFASILNNQNILFNNIDQLHGHLVKIITQPQNYIAEVKLDYQILKTYAWEIFSSTIIEQIN